MRQDRSGDLDDHIGVHPDLVVRGDMGEPDVNRIAGAVKTR